MKFAIPFFLFGCHATFLQSGMNSEGTAYSDLPFHMNIITSIAFGVNSHRTSLWPFVTTFFANETLIYPIIPDYHSAALVACGASVRMSLLIPSFLLLVSLIIGLYTLAQSFSAHKIVPELSVFLFILAGGNGWKLIFNKDNMDMYNLNFAHNFGDRETFWIHSVIHFLFPQRSAMFSMPIIICVMTCIIEIRQNSYQNRLLLFFSGFLVSLIPMCSGHSFIGICLFCFFCAICDFPWFLKNKWLSFTYNWIIFAVPIIIIGVPQAIMFVGRAKGDSFMSIDPIWNDYFKGFFAPFIMWWESLSSFVFISVFYSWFVLSSKQVMFYLPSFVLFIISNFIRYQPGAMDNTKVFYAGWYPMACICVAEFLIKYYYKPGLFYSIAIQIVFFSMILSGLLCIIKSLLIPFPVFENEDWETGHWIIENTPLNSVFLTNFYPGCSATAIAGRTGFLTFPGWVWTHGLPLNDRYNLVNKMWKNLATYEDFVKNGVNYILGSNTRESKDFMVDVYNPDYLIVCKEENVTIWRVVKSLQHGPSY